MSLSSGGGGGGDGDGGGDGTDRRPRGGDGESDGDDTLSLRTVRAVARAVLQSWLQSLPRVVRKFFRNPIAVMLSIVVGFVWYDIVRPVLTGLWQAALALIGGILVLGQSIVVLGNALIGALVGGFAPVGGAILDTVAQFNTAVAQAAAEAGLAAPLVVTSLYGIEFGVAGYLAVSLVESVDLPVVDLGGILRALTAPVKFVAGVLR